MTETDTGGTPPAYLSATRETVLPETAAHLHAFDIAHIVMLTESGIVTPEVGAAIAGALVDAARGDVYAARVEAGGGNHAGENLVSARFDASTGAQLGLARSSGDLSAVSFRLSTRTRLLEMMEAIYQLREALIRFTERHAEDVVAANTYGQQAQPTTFGHWALMIDSALTRDSERLVALYNRINRSPAGACILTGSDFPINRLRTAELLGFEGLVENTYDAVMSHDLEMEFAAKLTILSQTVARLADDMILWSTTEIGIVRLPDWFCGTISTMPQKRNPLGLQEIRGLAARAIGMMTAVTMAERGPTGFTSVERHASDAAMRDLSADLVERLPVLGRMLDEAEIDTDRGLALARRHWSTATDLAALFVRENGLAWPHAHALVGDVVQDALARGTTPAKLTAADVARVARAAGETDIATTQAEIDTALDPAAFVRRRDTLGGPGPAAIAGGLMSAQSRIRLGRSVLADRHRALATAEHRRMAAAEAVISGVFRAAGE